MSKIEIDFNNLKYNLYELLNVSKDAEELKIKKNFMKIIKNFHPDKNSELEEDIYYHIILANQILLQKESRRKYDEYLLDKAEIFSELKDSFNKTMKNQVVTTKDLNLFNNKVKELNNKHGYDENMKETVMERFSSIKQNRTINIEKENFRSMSEFNNKFNNNKVAGKYKDQIIEYKDAPAELSTYVIGEHYTNLGDIDKLYIDDSVQSSKYSSLDRAFMIQPVIQLDNKSIEDKMKDYKNDTEEYNKKLLSKTLSKVFN
jgi:curved DNA-binding protein CbpA